MKLTASRSAMDRIELLLVRTASALGRGARRTVRTVELSSVAVYLRAPGVVSGYPRISGAYEEPALPDLPMRAGGIFSSGENDEVPLRYVSDRKVYTQGADGVLRIELIEGIGVEIVMAGGWAQGYPMQDVIGWQRARLTLASPSPERKG